MPPSVLQLCVSNAGVWVKAGALSRALLAAGVAHSRVAKQPRDVHAFVEFASAEDLERARGAVVAGKQGRPLSFKPLAAGHVRREAELLEQRQHAPPPQQQQQQQRLFRQQRDGGDGVAAPPRDVLDAVAPWRNVPYVEQLARKQREAEAALARIARRIEAFSGGGGGGGGGGGAGAGRKRPRTEAGSGPDADAASQGAPCCPAAAIVAGPAGSEVGYRNKCEFSIGFDAAGAPCVGFRAGSFNETVAVAPPTGSPHLPPAMLAVVEAVQAFLAASPLRPYDLRAHTGVWRQATVRWAAASAHAMVDLLATPPGTAQGEPAVGSAKAAAAASADPEEPSAAAAEAAPEQLLEQQRVYRAEIARFVAAMGLLEGGAADGAAGAASAASAAGAGASSAIRAVSVLLQEYCGNSSPDAAVPRALLLGAPHALERLCGMQFLVSPGAFFQVNSAAAERLYYLVRALAIDGVEGGRRVLGGGPAAAAPFELTAPLARRADVALLDVCCGTGTIGLVCAPFVGRVVGVELSPQAVADAERNRALNAAATGATRVTFVCGKAEALMRDHLLPLLQPPPPPPPHSQQQQQRRHEGTGAGAGAGADAGAGSGAVAESATVVADAAAEEGAAGDGGASGAAAEAAPGAGVAGAAAAAAATSRVVAVVDPPRGGLHQDVLRALRTCRALKRVVYVSCNPAGSLVEDAALLCAPQQHGGRSAARGPPFRCVAAFPVDLFPHTPHAEMVLLLERD